MCELCVPRVTRRDAIAVIGGAALGALATSPPLAAAAARAVPTGYGIDIRPRDAWAGADLASRGTPQPEITRFLLVHHTAGPSTGDPIDLMRDIHAFHTGPARGWPDVAYNFFIEPGGVVYEARQGSLDGAVEASATGGNQGSAQLVCLLGDFTTSNPSDAQLDSLNRTLAWLADRHDLDTSPGGEATFTSRGSNLWPAGEEVTTAIVSGHRDMSATACPGDTFYPYLKDVVQAEVHALRQNSTTAPVSTTAPTVAPPAPTTAASSTVASATGPSSTVAAEATPSSAAASDDDARTPAPTANTTTATATTTTTATAAESNSSGSPSIVAVAVGGAALAGIGAVAVVAGARRRSDGGGQDSEGRGFPPPSGPAAQPPPSGFT